MVEHPTPLDFAQRLLGSPPAGSLSTLLGQLAGVFAADGAGLASLADGRILARQNTLADWSHAETIARVQAASTACILPGPNGSSLLAAASDGWLFWLERTSGAAWQPTDGSALRLIAAVVSQAPATPTAPRWAQQLDLQRRQRRLEEVAAVTRRVSHDFGNVLTSILGFTELALSEVKSERLARQHLKEVHDAAQRGAQWTHHLRLFTRRGAGRSSGGSSLTDVLTIEEARLHEMGHGGTALRLRVEPDLPRLTLEPEQLRQLVVCLLDNAREALQGEGAVTLTARTTELTAEDCLDLYGSPRPGPMVEILVSDTGVGLSDEAWQKLLVEPFFTTKPGHRGLGLGVVYGLVQSYRGGFRIERGPESGTIVQVFLPPTATSALRAIVVPATGTAPPTSGERVLVVDDDPLILELVCSTLRQAGYRVKAAATAEEALTSYVEAGPEPFGLVLSDVLMPRMNGVDLVRCLLRQDAQVNVLFMSGLVSAEQARQGVSGREFDLLPKPFRPEGLLRAVRIALDRSVRRQPV